MSRTAELIKYVSEEKDPTDGDEENNWTDWRENHTISAVCLFCNFTTTNVPVGINTHMSDYHHFNFKDVTKKLNVYSKIKLINYIRTKVREMNCFVCNEKFISDQDLLSHMKSFNHCHLPDSMCWDQLKYMFPILENDGLLLYLDEDDSFNRASPLEDRIVFPEEMAYTTSRSVLDNKSLREELLRDMNNENLGLNYQCFFCGFIKSGKEGKEKCISHMNSMHGFDFMMLNNYESALKKDFMIYIRYMSQSGHCYVCEKSFVIRSALEEHRILAEHTALPSTELLEKYRNKFYDSVCANSGFLTT